MKSHNTNSISQLLPKIPPVLSRRLNLSKIRLHPLTPFALPPLSYIHTFSSSLTAISLPPFPSCHVPLRDPFLLPTITTFITARIRFSTPLTRLAYLDHLSDTVFLA